MEKITNPTWEMWMLYKARKNWLEEQIESVKNMDLLTDTGRRMILDGLQHELDHVQDKIDDLLL